MAAWEPAALRGFVEEVVKELRVLCYKAKSAAFGACRDQFFYLSNSGVWERRQMSDVQALTLINTHVRALVEGGALRSEAGVSTAVHDAQTKLQRLVSRAKGEDKVQTLLDELAKHGEFSE
jgi:hypothetical protein